MIINLRKQELQLLHPIILTRTNPNSETIIIIIIIAVKEDPCMEIITIPTPIPIPNLIQTPILNQATVVTTQAIQTSKEISPSTPSLGLSYL